MDELESLAQNRVTTERAAENDGTDDEGRIAETPLLLEEIHLEKITIDGICGVY